MNITIGRIFRHFLNSYVEIMETSPHPKMSPLFEDFFTKQELIDILNDMFGNSIELCEVDFKEASNKELLEAIDDEVYILRYYLKKWEQELETHDHISPRGVWNTLAQLGRESHYLSQKEISLWDNYDISNYMSMQRKAGKIIRVFGIYDVMITEEDVYKVDSHPKRFFETKQDAEEIMHSCIKQEKLKKDEVHILERYKAI